MRYQGKIVDWNEARGFGFILWNGGSDKLFVHVSAFGEIYRKPKNGDIVTYAVSKDAHGRSQASGVEIVDDASSRRPKRIQRASTWRRMIAPLLIVLFAIGTYEKFRPLSHIDENRVTIGQSNEVKPLQSERAEMAAPNTEPKPNYESPLTSFSATKSQFRCEGKIYCSQMTSCDEAKFYLHNCPGTKIDSDNDGEPCESQWCTY
jgi:cold shock CspA family protein